MIKNWRRVDKKKEIAEKEAQQKREEDIAKQSRKINQMVR